MGLPDITGRRVLDGTPELELAPGDYGRLVVSAAEGEVRPNALEGFWAVNLPAIGAWPKSYRARVNPKVHTIEEHDDGTVTITPSISLKLGDGREVWHGYLRAGVWSAA